MLRRAPARALALVTAAAVVSCSPTEEPEVDPPAPTGTSVSPAATGTSSPPSPSGSPTASGSAAGTPSTPAPGPDAQVAVTGTVAEGLEVPWGLTFLPGGDALVSERDSARVLRVSPDGTTTELGTVPGVVARGEGGLLGLAVSPTFAEDRLLYAYRTTDEGNQVVRMPLEQGRIGSPEVVLDGIESSPIHNGGRIAFGPDGFLYVGTGDASQEELAQDVDSLNGKILRITADGEPAPGNPFEGSPVWSLGHRNVEGLAWDAQGRLWASEFGASTADELNLIEKGGNYGWPLVEGVAGDDRFIDPVRTWSPQEASPAGVAVAGDAVYIAALRGARLWQVPVASSNAGDAGEPVDHLTGEYGRLRSVEVAPDGALWLTTSNRDGRGDPEPSDDRILRLELR